uniref:CUB domain-containing protein n=1 Tax=Mesocestoides corti TaxID=53468 RepID=A0A5K3EXK8_MESCO
MSFVGSASKLFALVFLILYNQISDGLRAPPNMDPLVILQHPNCRCYVFSSAKRIHGVFKSPNFPAPYPDQIDCIIYLFQGGACEIVQITFLTIELAPPRVDVCFDYVAIVNYNETRLSMSQQRKTLTSSDVVRRQSVPPSVLCGTLPMLKKTTFFSETNSLALVFHSTTRAPLEQSKQMSGFQGTFLFLNSSNYKVNGDHLRGTECSYVIQSSQSKRLLVSGRIVSPRFPNDYPPNVRCAYTFLGRRNERVVIAVRLLQLRHLDGAGINNGTSTSCVYETSPLSSFDRILIHTLPKERWTEPVLFARLCGSLTSFQIISEEPSLQLTFISLPFGPKNGRFLMEYVFVKGTSVKPSSWTPTVPAFFEQWSMKQSTQEVFNYLQSAQPSNTQNMELGMQRHVL